TANGNAPLTPQQRDNMLALMAGNDAHTARNSNNALMSPTPPTMPDLNQFKQTQQQLEMLTNLQKSQDEKVQDLHRRLQPLSPTGSIPGLAQTGDEDPFNLTGAPGDYDPNAFIDFGDSSWNDIPAAGEGNAPGFEFGAPGGEGADVGWDFDAEADREMFGTSPLAPSGLMPQGQDGARKVESVSSEATSPALTLPDDPGTPRKRQRRVG
ncbi:Heat shock transcription factor, partial [Teratosphaeriaceae sp. CCFEE 6253]